MEAALPAAVAPAEPAPAATAPTATDARSVGTVRVIGSEHRFVLIEVPSGMTASLPDGQMLRCAATAAADAPAAASLRVVAERRRPFVVADVLSGEPQPGNNVFLVPTPPSLSPSPTAPPASSTRNP